MQNFWNKFKGNQATGVDSNYLIGLGLALVVVITLWWTPLLFPFRIFTTTVHEASHALAAVVTGGQVTCFEVETSGAGLTCTRGGWGFLISSAGYLGSTILGGLMLIGAKNQRGRRNLLYALTVGVVLVLLFFALNIFSLFAGGVQRDFLTLALVGLVAAIFGLVAYKGPDLLVTFFVYVTALLSTLYAVFDLITLVTINAGNNNIHNDARNLEYYTGIPALFWAVLWSLLTALILWQTFRVIIRRRQGKGPAFFGSKGSKPGKGTKSAFDSFDELKRR
ncbi:MAG: M50 family metallopeptidase [Chloroflexota bacterium]|nr:M50 family metallopeptidase [Chloroflexota bacterium]